MSAITKLSGNRTEDLRKRPVAYTLNLDDPQLEFGYISIEKTVADGLVRIW